MIPSIDRSYRAAGEAAIFETMVIPKPGPDLPRRGGAIRAFIGRTLLRLMGWRIDPDLPNLPKFVAIAAPHSSGWDFIVGIAFLFTLRLDARYIGKAELFHGPLGPLMRWLGGMPVDRDRPRGAVEQTVALFHSSEKLIVALAPEGTRKPVEKWKTGFYRIALGAGVPIVPGYFDNGRRVVGLGPPFHPTGDTEADVAALRAFYAKIPRRDGRNAISEPALP
jgi:1-acyl-sn-glycerol-3-phosphate acyltransferase